MFPARDGERKRTCTGMDGDDGGAWGGAVSGTVHF